MWPFFIRQQEHHSRLLSKESDKTKFLFQRASPSSSEQNKLKTIAKGFTFIAKYVSLKCFAPGGQEESVFCPLLYLTGDTVPNSILFMAGLHKFLFNPFIDIGMIVEKYFQIYLNLS